MPALCTRLHIQELQGDLFDQVRADPLTLETTFQRLVHRLGAEGVVTPTLIDSHRPERQSAWRPLHLDTAPLPPEDRAWRQPHRACVRRLEPPRPLILVAPDRWRLEGDRHEELKIQAWRSSERLSGHWWSTPYDRTEHWAQLEDGRLIWLSHRHGTDRWFLQGWLD